MGTVVRLTRAERAARRARVIKLLDRFPEAEAVANGRHLSLEVRGRRFGRLLDDRHGARRLALYCRAPSVEALDTGVAVPELGPRSWVSTWLDLEEVDWSMVGELLADAYRMTAPRSLVRRFWESE